tara:strand:+ start:147 stop:596 length:450 start_codon:yes stop_codon:yes gene_type:complete
MQKFLIIIFFLLLNSSSVVSKENNYFLSLKKNKVYVRYGPGKNYPIKYIYKKKFLPIKVIDKKDNFRRIIDHKKNSGWIHISQLKKANSLIPLQDKILFKKPSNFSKPLAKIKKGRVLIVLKCEENWCKIKTGKFKGWIRKKNVWGQVY